MSKFHYPSRLSRKEQEELLREFCEAISVIKDSREAAEFVRDLLSLPEIEMLAKRLKIAKFLIDGRTFEEITRLLKVSQGTIARVNEWLHHAGDGYRRVAERTKKEKTRHEPTRWHHIKRNYPLYYWPQLLLEEIIKNAKKKEKERLQIILDQLGEKRKLYKDVDSLLRKYG